MKDIEPDRFEGCLLGLALGDAMGAPFEGGPIERLLWRCIGRTRKGEMRWTDDTQMSLDLAESLVSKGDLDPDDLAQRFAGSYRWSRGYGPGAAKILKRLRRGADWRQASRSVYPDGSYGNGAAMRAPVVGLFHAGRPAEMLEAARASARVTHAHPLGVEGAVLLASATASALTARDARELLKAVGGPLQSDEFKRRFAIARAWIEDARQPAAIEVRKALGNGIASVDSCVTATYIAARFMRLSFEEMHAFVVAVGGDVDTIGAMAGAVWGATNGATTLPAAPLSRLEQKDRLVATAQTLHARSR